MNHAPQDDDSTLVRKSPVTFVGKKRAYLFPSITIFSLYSFFLFFPRRAHTHIGPRPRATHHARPRAARFRRYRAATRHSHILLQCARPPSPHARTDAAQRQTPTTAKSAAHEATGAQDETRDIRTEHTTTQNTATLTPWVLASSIAHHTASLDMRSQRQAARQDITPQPHLHVRCAHTTHSHVRAPPSPLPSGPDQCTYLPTTRVNHAQ